MHAMLCSCKGCPAAAEPTLAHNRSACRHAQQGPAEDVARRQHGRLIQQHRCLRVLPQPQLPEHRISKAIRLTKDAACRCLQGRAGQMESCVCVQQGYCGSLQNRERVHAILLNWCMSQK